MKIYSGGPLDYPETTMARLFHETAAKNADKPGYKARAAKGQPFRTYTWRETQTSVDEVANGLLAEGLLPGDRFALVSETRMEWSLADFGILSAGGITVTVYPTLTADQIAYLLNDSGATGIFVEDQKQLDKLAKVAAQVKGLRRVVLFQPCTVPASLEKITTTLDAFRAQGRGYATANPTALARRLEAGKPDDLVTLVYTSGTTGTPKGAMLTNRNFISATKSARKLMELDDALAKNPGATTTVFLPLAHCYGRIHLFMGVDMGVPVAFGSVSNLGEDFKDTRPFMIASVPRLYERMYAQIIKKVEEGPESRQKIFQRAADVARRYGKAVSNGGRAPFMLSIQHAIFEKLVYAKLRDAVGLPDLKAGTTGAAAIRPDLLYFFQGVGIPVLEGYGLTETSAPSNVNPPRKFKPGTVGPPFPGMEMTLAEDGEILMKGPNVFQGYYNLPKETAESFTEDRWFKTGDIGAFDEDGYLRITDRKKELEVLNTGKKIAPVTVEEKLKLSPYVGEALLVATDKKFAGCLIQPNFDALVSWAGKNGVAFDKSKVIVKPDPTGVPTTYSVGRDLLDNPKVKALYAAEVATCNTQCADFEQIKVWDLAEHVFTMDRDELTPTLKKKRRVIAKNYAAHIDAMFKGKSDA